MFKGVYTALITPFLENGQIDFPALDRLIDFQISSGVNGIVLLGTSAETAALSSDEQKQILDFAVKKIDGRVDVIIGVGTNSTEKTFKSAHEFLAYKPDGFLIVTPYYVKPNMSGLIAHYKKMSELKTPIVIYHIPGRTGQRLTAAQMEKLTSEVPLIKAIKECDYDIQNVTDSAVRLHGKVELLTGNEDMYLQIMSLGGSGVISAGCNLLCKEFVEIYESKDPFETFRRIFKVIQACYYETNPVCVKYMLSKAGLCGPTVRLPLGPLAEETKQRIDNVLKDYLKK